MSDLPYSTETFTFIVVLSWGLSVSFIISSIPPNFLNHYFTVLQNKKKFIHKEEITPSFIATVISFVSFFVEIWKQIHELHFLGL